MTNLELAKAMRERFDAVGWTKHYNEMDGAYCLAGLLSLCEHGDAGVGDTSRFYEMGAGEIIAEISGVPVETASVVAFNDRTASSRADIVLFLDKLVERNS